MKKINYFRRIFVAVSIVLTIPFLTLGFISIGTSSSSQNSTNLETLNKFNTQSDKFKFISERTVSLRFILANSQNSSSWYYTEGTGWIFSKSSNYIYLATNFHVANTLLFPNKNLDFPYGKDSWYTNTYGPMLEIDLGFINPTTKGENFEDQNNQVHYIKLNEYPTIFYSSFSDDDFSTSYGTGYYSGLGINSSYNTQYPPTIDFAILKINISDISSSSPGFVNGEKFVANVNNFKIWLQNYDADPTTFYPQSLDLKSDDSKNYFIDQHFYFGGFSTTSLISYFDNINYTKKPLVAWTALKDIPMESFTSDLTPYVYMQKPDSYPLIIPTNDYVNNNPNSYKFGYTDVSVNGLISDNLYNGASGSMVINDDNQVVGIYWGSSTYLSNDGSQKIERGGFCFLNVSDYVGNDKLNYQGYDFIDDALNLIAKDK